AKRTALLALAAPTLFVFVGVVLTMLHDPVPDTWLWVACWAIAIALLLRYWLGAFFVLAHLSAGARAVMTGPGVTKVFADRFMVGSTIVAGIVATVIMLGMCGMRVQFI